MLLDIIILLLALWNAYVERTYTRLRRTTTKYYLVHNRAQHYSLGADTIRSSTGLPNLVLVLMISEIGRKSYDSMTTTIW